jgi:hypothetical protein
LMASLIRNQAPRVAGAQLRRSAICAIAIA